MQDVRKYSFIYFVHYTFEDPCLRISKFQSIGLCETRRRVERRGENTFEVVFLF